VTFEQLYRRELARDERRAVEARTAGLANALSVAVSHRMALLNGLRAFIEVNWGRPAFQQDFTAYARRLQGSIEGIRTVQWVSDGVIRQTWPAASNERAAGYDLRSDGRPFIREDYDRAERSAGIIISGPTELVQGGMGVIARMSARDSTGALLAVAAVVLDVLPLLSEAGLAGDSTLRLALRSADHGTIFGDSLVLRDRPVMVPVPLPEGEWLIAATPPGAWGAAGTSGVVAVRAVLVLLVGLSGAVGWLVSSRARARARADYEHERRLGEEKFSRLFALSPDGALVVRQADGLVLAANEGVEMVLGHPVDGLVSQALPEHPLWEDPGDWLAALTATRDEGGVRNLPIRFRTAGGQLRRGLFSARPIEIDGEPCLLVLIRDVTEQKLLEEQLAHAQKLEAVGRLAGGVAHDFNNLITVITGYTDLLRQSLDEADPRQADATEILRASSRAAGLTQQLLAFARRQLVQPRILDLNLLVANVTGLLERLLGEQVKIRLELAPEPAIVEVDPGQFEQLLMNLAVNARDAMPQGGRLAIRTRQTAEEVVLEVEDDGHGMAADVRTQMFEPFYTTKPPGKGTGLGLATVYGIVQQSGGRIAVASEVGEGARFTITLPRSRAQPAAALPPELHAVLVRGSERILVVEDDDQVRRLAERALGAAGYQVVSASAGEEALALVRSAAEPFQLLITDLVMPGWNGQEVAARFRALVPGAPVLMISGYTDDAATREGLLTAGQSFLPKPFTPAELAGRVRDLLEGRRDASP
jgi:PAS domain S-box-containing protein